MTATSGGFNKGDNMGQPRFEIVQEDMGGWVSAGYIQPIDQFPQTARYAR